MAKASLASDGKLLFWCPGCDEAHGVGTDRWEWNGSVDEPTLSPSVLVRSARPIQGGVPVSPFKFEGDYPPPEGVCDPFVCHSFVRGGRIEFLGDCSHALAGQTVELPDWETKGVR